MNIAMIGSGGMAGHHLGTLAEEPGVKIVGHASPTPGHAEEAAHRWGGRAYTSHEALLKKEDVDAAWICVPPGSHGAIEGDLIGRNVPFFVEKPLSAGRETAEEIAALLGHGNFIVAVGYHWRALDTIPEVQRTLAERPPRMILGAWHDRTPPPRWWRRQESSGGQMVEQATHLLDIARFLAGEARVIAATADRHERPDYPEMDVADVSSAILRYDSGATGIFTATCLLDHKAEVHVKVICEGLHITITQSRVVYDGGQERREVRTGNDPVQSENRAFLAAVRQNDPSLVTCNYADALKSHRLCLDVRAAGARQSEIEKNSQGERS